MDQNTEKNRSDILRFANDRDFGKVASIEKKAFGMESWKEWEIAGIKEFLGTTSAEQFSDGRFYRTGGHSGPSLQHMAMPSIHQGQAGILGWPIGLISFSG